MNADARLTGFAALAVLVYPISDLLFPPALPVASMAAGLAMAGLAWTPGMRKIAVLPTTLLAAAGVALLLSGVLTDRSQHTSALTVFVMLGAAGALLLATSSTLTGSQRVLCTAAGLSALGGYIAQVSGHVDIEQLAVYPILAGVFVLGWRARNTERHEVRV